MYADPLDEKPARNSHRSAGIDDRFDRDHRTQSVHCPDRKVLTIDHRLIAPGDFGQNHLLACVTEGVFSHTAIVRLSPDNLEDKRLEFDKCIRVP
jgi:hypothetical protein